MRIIITSRRFARGLGAGANGEVETRRTWHVLCSFSRWSGKTDHFSWVANRQTQQLSIVERVGLRAASGNGGDELACDVCQMNPVYVMCYEDRAFLCRSCDVNIHSANGSPRSTNGSYSRTLAWSSNL